MGGLRDGVINSGFADEHAMQIVSLVWGILALLGVLAALTPFFGALTGCSSLLPSSARSYPQS